MTETAELIDLASAGAVLRELAALGVVLALDDFGAGYSSLSHAQALPVDILKVDRSFVAASASGDSRAVATIAAVCALASRLEVDVVAEGVEDLSQIAELQALGCAYGQGNALALPLTPVALRAGLAQHRARAWVLEPLGA